MHRLAMQLINTRYYQLQSLIVCCGIIKIFHLMSLAAELIALKVGGIFIVPKCADVDNLLPVILTMFEIKETDKTHVTFVKEK